MGYTALIVESESIEERAKMMSAVNRSAERMKQIIDDFLSLERVEQLATEPPTQPVCMNTLMGRLEGDYSCQAAEKGVALQVVSSGRASLDVAGDEAQLYEAISNLVGNAIKYTPHGGNVRVMLSEKTGTVQFEVVDTGLGIPQAQHERLFQPFYRALRDDIQAISGSGLGLYLVKSIVTRHGGQMIFQSAAGQGSTFGFTLPLLMQDDLKSPISTGSTETLMRDSEAIMPAWRTAAP